MTASARRARNGALKVALIGVMAATIEVGKLALSAIPNVEVVTLFCALFGYVFGPMGLAATLIFVWLETMIWGFNTWVFSYLLHWPAVCLTFWFLGRIGVKNRIWLTLAAVLLTVAFGVSSSLIDVAMYMQGGLLRWNITNYWYRFGIYYMRGIWFYVVQVACNVVAFPLLFAPLVRLLQSLARRHGLVRTNQLDHAIEPPDLVVEAVDRAWDGSSLTAEGDAQPTVEAAPTASPQDAPTDLDGDTVD